MWLSSDFTYPEFGPFEPNPRKSEYRKSLLQIAGNSAQSNLHKDMDAGAHIRCQILPRSINLHNSASSHKFKWKSEGRLIYLVCGTSSPLPQHAWKYDDIEMGDDHRCEEEPDSSSRLAKSSGTVRARAGKSFIRTRAAEIKTMPAFPKDRKRSSAITGSTRNANQTK